MLDNKSDNNSKIELIIEVRVEDLWEIYRYNESIKKRIRAGKGLPPNVLKKYFSLFTLQSDRIEKEYRKNIEVVREHTEKRFLTDRRFKFEENEIELKSKNDYSNYSEEEKLYTLDNMYKDAEDVYKDCCLKNAIDYIFTSLYSNFTDIDNSRDGYLKFIYQNINDYFRLYNFNDFDGDSYKVCQHYKRSILAGYITLKLGFSLSTEIKPFTIEKNAPKNDQIYQSVKYYTDKLKPIKIKKEKRD